MRRLCSVVVLFAALTAGTPDAQAAILPGQTIDGPSTDIKGFGNVDVAPDGTGAVAYRKNVGGVSHIFVARIANGAYGAPERVDTGVTTPSGGPRVAASNGGKLVVVYVTDTGANETARAAVSSGAGQPFADAPFNTGNPWVSVDVDANPAGQAYAIGTETVGANTNVHAFRLNGAAWTQAGAPQLDNAAGNEAGGFQTQDQPRIAVTGDGNAVAVWPEKEAASNEIYLRQLTGTTAGPIVQATLANLDGRARGTNANMVDVDAEGAGAVWVALREDFKYPPSGGGADLGKGRVLLRRFAGGSLGAQQVPDGLPNPTDDGTEEPEISVNDAGQGLMGTYRQTANEAHSAALAGGTWSYVGRLDVPPNDLKPFPTPAIGDNGAGLFEQVVRPNNTSPSAAQARTYVNGQLGPVIPVSDTALGGIADGGIDVSADANGNGFIAYQQSTDGGTTLRIVGAKVDGPAPPGGGGGPGGGGPTPDTDAPHVTGTKLFPNKFAIGTGTPASLNPAAVRLGTTIRFVVSEDAKVRFLFERPTVGRSVGGRCVKATRRNRTRRRCTLWVSDGSFTLNRKAGQNSVRFSGRLSARRKLGLGKHRVTLTPTDAAGNVGPFQRRPLTIVKRR